MSTPSSDSSSSPSTFDMMKTPPAWVFIAAPIATLVFVVIITIIVLVVKHNKVKKAMEKADKRGVSSFEAQLLQA
jgi:mannose/fructose/N-acetylgalactosamine-specific phosphotransferase system component IIC